MSDKKVVPLHPTKEESSPEERTRRLQAEVNRLAGLPDVEWMLYLPDTAEKHDVTETNLKQMVKRAIWERLTPEERTRRLQAEVDRLADLPVVEWMTCLQESANKHRITKTDLKKMVERTISKRANAQKEADKKVKEQKVERDKEFEKLEQISLGSNREDSQRFINERVCRH